MFIKFTLFTKYTRPRFWNSLSSSHSKKVRTQTASDKVAEAAVELAARALGATKR
jgi:hypothetical protein